MNYTSTEAFAAMHLVRPQSVRSRYCRKGSYFGVRPRKLPNGRLLWPVGAKITGPSAQQAFDEVNRMCGDTRRPMLVDMATTKSVAREARAADASP